MSRNISSSHFNKMLKDIESSEELYYVAMTTLFVLTDNKRYSTLADLISVLDQKNFTQFITCYEGQTITVPCKEQVTETMQILNLYYLCEVKGIEWSTALEKLEIPRDRETSLKLRGHVSKLKQIMVQIDIPIDLKVRKPKR